MKSNMVKDDILNREIEDEHKTISKRVYCNERKLTIGTNKYTEVFAADEKGAGGANHHYIVVHTFKNKSSQGFCEEHFADTSFQNGAIKEYGVNGCHNEDLIAIVIDRLQGFQSGEFSCMENAIALTKLEESLMWLRKRTNDRIKRGVEGLNIV